MTQLRTSMIIDLAGNLSGRANQFLTSMQRLGTGGSRSMQILQRSTHAASQGLDKLGNRYTAMLTGGGLVLQIKQVADLEERFTRLGIDAGKSSEIIAGLKNKIYEAAKAPEIRVDPGEITSAIEAIINKTGDLKFAQENIRNIGMAIQATGAQGKDIGELMGEFQKMGIIDPKETLKAIDTLVLQGKEGAFTLKELAALGPRVITAYTAKGRGGVQAIREMGAALQMIRMGTGDANMAATAFENVMKTFTDNKKLKVLQAGGIQVFDPEAAKKGKEMVRPVHELMAEIIRKTKGKGTLLNEVFDSEAIRAFNQAAGEFQRTGKLESLERFYNVQADGTTTLKDSTRAANTANAALTNLLTVWKQFADNQLTGPITKLTGALDGLQPGTVERWLKIGSHVVAVSAGLIAIQKIATARKGLFGASTANGGPGGAGLVPIPVYIVNGPGSGGMPTGGGAGQPGTKLGKVSRIGKIAGAATQVGAAGMIGYTLGEVINEIIGVTNDKLTGGKYKGPGSAGEALYDLLHSPENSSSNVPTKKIGAPTQKTEVGGTLDIRITREGDFRLQKIQSNNKNFNINVDSGLTMIGN